MKSTLLAALMLFSTVTAAAEDKEDKNDPRLLLRRGITLHREAAYAASVAALELARQGKMLEPNERTELGFYLAADYVALNSLGAAKRELRAVLEADPNYEVPQYTSPKVAALFRETQEELERQPRLRILPPQRDRVRPDDVVVLWFEPVRFGGSAFGAARWRWKGESDWREAPLGHGGDEKMMARVELDRRSGTLEFWAEARGPSGSATAAASDRPLELPVVARAGALSLVTAEKDQPSKKKSIAKAWWLWTTVGIVAAAGLGVGLYYALRPPSGGTADAVLDFQVR
jgi:hypothetical protein